MNDLVDTYLTIAAPSEGIYKEKGSKFLSFAYPVTSIDEIKALIEQKRKEHHNARHVCFAYMLGADRATFRTNDDGEPSGTAGRPILGQINSNQLTDILIIVVRYFGGILLGTGGLTQAYKSAAAEAIAAANIEERLVEAVYKVKFGYEVMNDVMRVIKEYALFIVSQEQTLDCRITFRVRETMEIEVVEKLSNIQLLKLEKVR
ncbi:MAG: YigZ family protein [Bacteroidota bacterium]|nr:YigZ family protein [Bacteroidota bacterium]HOA46352.1 YigZ family protein [Paludibacteraceae bacterium]HOO23489.1 YigZ family protein [Paludibacteraceae bacterium]HPD27955.1 YigZ family protein [Paludibacteraceae bacterium]HPW96427.1 YigZ family protein [Paludibacteraceae bacterium]